MDTIVVALYEHCRDEIIEFIFGRKFKNCSLIEVFKTYFKIYNSPEFFIDLERSFYNFLEDNSVSNNELCQAKQKLEDATDYIVDIGLVDSENSEQENEQIFLIAGITFLRMKQMLHKISYEIENSALNFHEVIGGATALLYFIVNSVEKLLKLNCSDACIIYTDDALSLLEYISTLDYVEAFHSEFIDVSAVYFKRIITELMLWNSWALSKEDRHRESLEMLHNFYRVEPVKTKKCIELSSRVLVVLSIACLKNQEFVDAAKLLTEVFENTRRLSVDFRSTRRVSEAQMRKKKGLLRLAHLLFSAYLMHYPNEFTAEQIFEQDVAPREVKDLYDNLLNSYQLFYARQLYALCIKNELRSPGFSARQQIVVALWRMYVAVPKEPLLEILVPENLSFNGVFEVVQKLIITYPNYLSHCVKLFCTVLNIFKINEKYRDAKDICVKLDILANEAYEDDDMELSLVWEMFLLKIHAANSDARQIEYRNACKRFFIKIFEIAYISWKIKDPALKSRIETILHFVTQLIVFSEEAISDYIRCSDVKASTSSSAAMGLKKWNVGLLYLYQYLCSSATMLDEDFQEFVLAKILEISTEYEYRHLYSWKFLIYCIQRNYEIAEKTGCPDEVLNWISRALSKLYACASALCDQNLRQRFKQKILWCFKVCSYMSIQTSIDVKKRFEFISMAIHFQELVVYCSDVPEKAEACLVLAINYGISIAQNEPNIDASYQYIRKAETFIHCYKESRRPFFGELNADNKTVHLLQREAAILTCAPNCHTLVEHALKSTENPEFLEIIAANLLNSNIKLNYKLCIKALKIATSLRMNSKSIHGFEKIDRNCRIIFQIYRYVANFYHRKARQEALVHSREVLETVRSNKDAYPKDKVLWWKDRCFEEEAGHLRKGNLLCAEEWNALKGQFFLIIFY